MTLNKEEKQFLLGLLQDAKTQTINNSYETTLWFIEKTINEDAFHELKKAYDKKAKLITSLETRIEGE